MLCDVIVNVVAVKFITNASVFMYLQLITVYIKLEDLLTENTFTYYILYRPSPSPKDVSSREEQFAGI